MPTNTTNMALPKPIDSDNAESALASSIPSAFEKIDVHRHTGGTDGLTIPAAGLAAGAATGAALGSDVATLTGAQTLTNKTLTAPTVTSPTITGTVAGGATYNTPLMTSPAKVDGYRVVVNDQTSDALLLNGTGVSSNAAEVTVTFSHAFSNAPVVVATIFLGGTLFAYTLRIAAITTTNFTFSVIDSAAARVNGITINFIAFGAR